MRAIRTRLEKLAESRRPRGDGGRAFWERLFKVYGSPGEEQPELTGEKLAELNAQFEENLNRVYGEQQ